MRIHVKAGQCIVSNNNHYQGYGPVSTRGGLVIELLGAPRLFQRTTLPGATRDIVQENEANVCSALIIRELLKESDVSRWGAFLAGNFLIVVNNPTNARCWVITDLGNSYHCYYGTTSDGGIVFATDIDTLAVELNQFNNLDPVSIVEYLTQISCTYPHTFYRDIKELSFASVTQCHYRNKVQSTTTQYWLPTCGRDEVINDVHALAPILHDRVLSVVKDALPEKRRVGLFLSGGIDSRTIAGILKSLGVHGTAITIVDAPNLESHIAARIASACGHTHEIWYRDQEHCPRVCDEYITLEGPHATFVRCGHLGFRNRICERGFDAIFGGYMSDTLLKLHEANVIPKCFLGRNLGPLETFDPHALKELRGGEHWQRQFDAIFHRELLDAAQARRKEILMYWNNLRQDGSAWEWSWIWPFSRNKQNSSLTTHIFYYPSYEVFSDRAIIEVARVASQKIKLNGRLFNAAMWSFLKHTAAIPVTVTGLPMFRSKFFYETAIAIKHIPPRRWLFRKEAQSVQSANPVAGQGSYPNTSALWRLSAVLKQYRAQYDIASGLERQIMRPSTYDVFSRERYGNLTESSVQHIMYTMLHLDRWEKHRRVLQHSEAMRYEFIPGRASTIRESILGV